MNEQRVKINNRIGAKLFRLTLTVIVISVALTATIQHLGTKKIVGQALDENATAAMTAIHYQVEDLQNNSLKIAQVMSNDEALIKAIESGESGAVREAAHNVVLRERSDVEFVTIGNKDGAVLARTHSDKVGDSVASHRNFIDARGGTTGSYVETGTAVKLSVISSAPVKNSGGEIIGTVAMGYQLDNVDFVDRLKAMTGADITIFSGDERVNTTIIRNGERQIGTTLNPEVAETVLNNKQRFCAITTILDTKYYAVYDPIITDGEAIGVYFAGIDLTGIKQSEKTLIITELTSVLSAAFIILMVSIYISRKMIVNPVLAVSKAARELADGNLNVNLPVRKSKDEIGLLTDSVLSVINVLQSLIREMKSMADAHAVGAITTAIDESRYKGAYKDVASGTNLMVESYKKHMRDICLLLREFGNGDFNAVFEELPGDKHIANEVIEEVRGNLRSVSGEIDALAVAALNGQLSVRANTDSFSGDWRILLTSLNSVMDAIIAPINAASEVLEKMANGLLDSRIEGTYKGDFEIIKRSVNKTQQSISSYVKEISETLAQMSAQNLDVGINRPYIGDFSIIRDSINEIIKEFNTALININASAETVATGSKHISDSSTELSMGASEQASAVQNLNAVINEVAEQTEVNAKTAQKVNEIAKTARERTESETIVMEAMLKAMEEINEASDNIARVIKVIDDIAFQTNLLALNASVEAARAGEKGKGFAVVAAEVRTLASRSKNAASETEALIESSRKKVQEGVATAHQTAKGLESIVGMITEVTQHIGDIAKASEVQLDSIIQINSGITQVSAVTQTNTSISEESAASAEELSGMAEMLHNTVSKFKLKS